MDCTFQQFEYYKTNSFSKLVLDYLSQKETLTSLYHHFPTKENLALQIAERTKQKTDRATLSSVLQEQYADLPKHNAVIKNLDLLAQEHTFTICTAHQPNIFTGHLYFIYKIIHAAKLAAYCKQAFPNYEFVPVYYMGSEDADLAELGHINIENEQLNWQTKQKGAVGRMLIDPEFIKLVQRLKQQFVVAPHGAEIIALLEQCYTIGKTVQKATQELVNALLGKFGVLVLVADDARLKRQMTNVFTKEITEHASSVSVAKNSDILASNYKEQAHSRAINLFYLKDDCRERIELIGDTYQVLNTDISFTQNELLSLINSNPELFSPNVILRGLFQETILPNIAFIGGGGELAYWLQLKQVFDDNAVVFPMLILRNSLLLQHKQQQQLWQKAGWQTEDLFTKKEDLIKLFVTQHSHNQLNTNAVQQSTASLYEQLKKDAGAVDITLTQHIDALLKKTNKRLQDLDKKLLRAEKRNFEDRTRQFTRVKDELFPNGNLQERYDNIVPYLAKYGVSLLDVLYNASLTIEQQFVVVTLPGYSN